jgi:hypothetical protein
MIRKGIQLEWRNDLAELIGALFRVRLAQDKFCYSARGLSS